MGLFIFFMSGLRVSRLLDIRGVYGPRTVQSGYLNGQEKTRKTENGTSEPRSLREQQEY